MSGRGASMACLAVLLACTAPAAARDRLPGAGAVSSAPWATVNVCDTSGHPDTIGVRGSMPGTGSAQDVLYMRIQVQYFDVASAGWRFVGTAADSGFLALGNGRAKRREGGQNFTIRPRSIAYVLRGLVTFEWRNDGDVVRRSRRVTRPGHPGTAGADPATASAGTCTVAG